MTRQALLDWPLEGTHRIEASAGTGKTFALALLHTRLVVERVLPVKNILAVTYTIAATEVLRTSWSSPSGLVMRSRSSAPIRVFSLPK